MISDSERCGTAGTDSGAVRILVQAGSSGFIPEASQESLLEKDESTERKQANAGVPSLGDTILIDSALDSQKYLPKMRNIKATSQLQQHRHPAS